jgi:RAB protein geranylgeranyltransferase component A
MVSTTVETDEPEAEIKTALDLLGPSLEMFLNVSQNF